jgi:hypothetical protein
MELWLEGMKQSTINIAVLLLQQSSFNLAFCSYLHLQFSIGLKF